MIWYAFVLTETYVWPLGAVSKLSCICVENNVIFNYTTKVFTGHSIDVMFIIVGGECVCSLYMIGCLLKDD